MILKKAALINKGSLFLVGIMILLVDVVFELL